MVVIREEDPLKEEESSNKEKEWDNPQNPEKAADERDIEQLKRQKKDVDQKNENLTEKPKN